MYSVKSSMPICSSQEYKLTIIDYVCRDQLKHHPSRLEITLFCHRTVIKVCTNADYSFYPQGISE